MHNPTKAGRSLAPNFTSPEARLLCFIYACCSAVRSTLTPMPHTGSSTSYWNYLTVYDTATDSWSSGPAVSVHIKFESKQTKLNSRCMVRHRCQLVGIMVGRWQWSARRCTWSADINPPLGARCLFTTRGQVIGRMGLRWCASNVSTAQLPF